MKHDTDLLALAAGGLFIDLLQKTSAIAFLDKRNMVQICPRAKKRLSRK